MERCDESGVGEGGEGIQGGKGRGEIGSEAGEVNGVVANVPTMDDLGIRYRTFSGWGMETRKVEVLLVIGGLMWTEVQKPDLSTKMSISRKVIWEREMVQVNRTILYTCQHTYHGM